MIVGLGLAGAVSLPRADLPKAMSSGFADGITQSALQSEIEETLVYRNLAIIAWSSLRYVLLTETPDGVVPGQDAWLFTDEEYQYSAKSADIMQQRLAQIIDTAHSLEADGIHLTVALLPDKSRIYDNRLRHPRPPAVEERYDLALLALHEAGVDAPDLVQPLAQASRTGQTFLARDTHWTPFGARTVAEALNPSVLRHSSERTTFVAEDADPVDHFGDLLRFVRTGPFDDRLGLGPERVTPTNVFADAASIGLFGDTPPIEVILVGTSYSADPTWGFAGFLQLESQTDLLNLSKIGEGPFLPMENLMQGDTLAENPISIVIWEIPERYLTLEEF